MAVTVTFEGTPRSVEIPFSINLVLNGRGTFSGNIVSKNAAYRPVLDDEVSVVDSEVTDPLFGGFVTNPFERGVLDEPGADISTRVTASDYNLLADECLITASIAAGSTLKQALQAIVSEFQGVTLHPSQVDGPALPADIVAADMKGIEFLNELTLQSGGYTWKIDSAKRLRMSLPGSVAAPFNITDGTSVTFGDITVEPSQKGFANYIVARSNQYRKIAQDAASIAATRRIQVLVTVPDNTPEDGVQQIADMYLARALPTQRQVVYTTRSKGLFPGMTQTINLPKRNVNNTFLITAVTITVGEDGVVSRVTALEGLVFQGNWQETYRAWGSGGTVNVGGGGSTVLLERFAYPLGGSGVEFVESPTPTWIPANGGSTTLGAGAVQVQINTVARGTTAATVIARLRALSAGVTVQARLYDVTAGAPCPGTSAVINSTTWQTVSFAVDLTPGSHFYELQLLPSAANEGVAGTGYVE